MLRTRVISGVVLAPLFLYLVFKGYPYFHILIAATAAMMAWEFTRMDGKAGLKRRTFVSTASGGAVVAMALGSPLTALIIVGGAIAVVILVDQCVGRPGVHVVHLAVAYVVLPAIALLYVSDVGGYISVFWVLAVVWATDIGAYAFGRLIGGPKLAPRISPNKTWSGALGGLLCAVLASGGLFWAFVAPPDAPVLAIAGFMSIMSQAGDLFESALKRRYQVKDSGALIPGHGGVMDRFDGLWAATPVAALFCVILGGGVQHW
ncbi:MAG: phosphatidate cytidylyltransferase [Reyranella sp.]